MGKLPPLIRAFLDPSKFPHFSKKVDLIQTQMSFILLTGNYVYKIKKPVNLGYLDYTSLKKRKFFCFKELKLNQRLSPNIYLKVVPITSKNGDFFLEGKGKIVEYALKMRQLPSEKMMDFLLWKDKVSKKMIEKLAQKIARFHKKAKTSKKISSYGKLKTISFNIKENFFQTKKYLGISIFPEDYKIVKEYSRDFIKKNLDLFEKRIKQGKIKDCHGDLHAAHICFFDDISIYDCIEFNDRFRYGDVASEIAFLSMDLDFWRQSSLSKFLVEIYQKATQDKDLFQILNFYKCYRAYVRGKVESFKLDDPYISGKEKEKSLQKAIRYFQLASFYAKKTKKPFLILIGGMIGTGKTSLAKILAQKLKCEVISSDIVRKKLAGIPLNKHQFEKFKKGIYSPDFTKKVYQKMFFEAKKILKEGQSVILDATFSKRKMRKKAIKIAQKLNADFLLIECLLDEKEIKKRLERRFKEKSISDATWEIYLSLKKEFEPINEIISPNHLPLETKKPPSILAKKILKRLERPYLFYN